MQITNLVHPSPVLRKKSIVVNATKTYLLSTYVCSIIKKQTFKTIRQGILPIKEADMKTL